MILMLNSTGEAGRSIETDMRSVLLTQFLGAIRTKSNSCSPDNRMWIRTDRLDYGLNSNHGAGKKRAQTRNGGGCAGVTGNDNGEGVLLVEELA